MPKTKTTKRRHNSVEILNNQSSRSRKQKKVAGSSDSTDEDRPSTSSSIRKKRGLSMRNGEQGENRQRQNKGRTPSKVVDDMSKVKPKRKKSETTTRKSQRKEADRADQYAERTVSAQATSRWKAMSKNTREFVLEALDSAIIYTLNETRASSYDDVQDRLNILRQRIVGALSDVTVPSISKQPDYRNMEQKCHSAEVSVAEASNQVVLLETEIQAHMRGITEKEELLEKMKSAEKDQNNQRRIHPILQKDTHDALGLPVIKASMVNKPPQASSTSGSHASLVKALKKWQSQDTVQNIGTFMDTLSNVTSTLQH